MKKQGHPPYQEILFVDSATGTKFICGSTLQSDKTEVYEGKEYPVIHVSVSSASHPFFTKSKQFIDSEGRVDKFMKRYANVGKKKEDASKVDAKQNPLPKTTSKEIKKKKA